MNPKGALTAVPDGRDKVDLAFVQTQPWAPHPTVAKRSSVGSHSSDGKCFSVEEVLQLDLSRVLVTVEQITLHLVY